MTYSPGYGLTMLPMVSVHTPMYSPFPDEGGSGGGSPSTAVFESANRIVYEPVALPRVCVARRLWWANGSSVSGTATVRVGIYRDAGMAPSGKVVEGSATQSGASEVQFVDITDTVLTPGLWWLAFTCDTTGAAAFLRTLTSVEFGWRLEETGSGTLPATATPVRSTPTQSAVYACGFSIQAS